MTTNERTCAEAGCTRVPVARSLCSMHYRQHKTAGTLDQFEKRNRLGGGTCTVEGCTNRWQARRMCAKHYQEDRARRNGAKQCRSGHCTSLAVFDGLCRKHHASRKRKDEHHELVSAKRCSVEGCDRPYDANGLCAMHYFRSRKHGGDPGPATLLRAPSGTGYVGSNGYRYFRRAGNRFVAEHREVMEQTLGRPLYPFENVHHRNGRRADNRPENLELWVTNQPYGQRPEDLVRFVVEHYPDAVRAALGNNQNSGPG